MADVRDLLPDTGEIGLVAWHGVIAKNATDVFDLLPVIIPEFDEHQLWGPCRWMSRSMDGVNLPHKGDECLVVKDNRRQLWIPVWWPS